MGFTTSDASGAYSTAGLPAGSYTLRFDPTASADQASQGYSALERQGGVAVSVGAVTGGVDVALARP